MITQILIDASLTTLTTLNSIRIHTQAYIIDPTITHTITIITTHGKATLTGPATVVEQRGTSPTLHQADLFVPVVPHNHPQHSSLQIQTQIQVQVQYGIIQCRQLSSHSVTKLAQHFKSTTSPNSHHTTIPSSIR